MGSRRLSAEQQEAVRRRLAELGAGLGAGLGDGLGGGSGDVRVEQPAADGTDWWEPHTRVVDDRPRLRVVDRPSPLWEPEPDDTVEVPAVPLGPPEPTRSAPEPPGSPGPPRVPIPGRHASRRLRGWSSTAWVDGWRERARFGPGQLSVVAVVVALGLGVTAWWVVRGDDRPVSTPTSPVAVTASPLTSIAPVPASAPGAPVATGAPVVSGSASPVAATGTVTVDVAGKVRQPGIAVLDSGSRVVDAIRAAGGARHGVDLTALNLARVLVDGEQIVVGEPAPTGAAASAVSVPDAGGAPAPGALVNLNTATAEQLDALPEVGPVTAQSILTWRDQHGGFTSVDELLEVDGIGETTLGRIAPYVTV